MSQRRAKPSRIVHLDDSRIPLIERRKLAIASMSSTGANVHCRVIGGKHLIAVVMPGDKDEVSPSDGQEIFESLTRLTEMLARVSKGEPDPFAKCPITHALEAVDLLRTMISAPEAEERLREWYKRDSALGNGHRYPPKT